MIFITPPLRTTTTSSDGPALCTCGSCRDTADVRTVSVVAIVALQGRELLAAYE
jgi:hypothetical protein